MKQFFLLAAVAGAIIPYVFFLDFFVEEGLVITSFVAALFSNGAAGGFTADLLISSVTFWVYLIWQRTERIWLFVLLNLTIGLSCALPLYFYFQAASQDSTAAPSQ